MKDKSYQLFSLKATDPSRLKNSAHEIPQMTRLNARSPRAFLFSVAPQPA
ncbi:hypothetical protein [Comamonas thiooxydans]|nr:hypothetical protein [Comamonas thiooxydans]